MTTKLTDRLKRTGLLSIAGIVAVVSVLFNIYQFSVNKRMQEEEYLIGLYQSWLQLYDRAQSLAARRDSTATFFLGEYDRLRGASSARLEQAPTDSLSKCVDELLSASAIWEHEAQIVVEAIRSADKQLYRRSENDTSSWLERDVLGRPPRVLAYDQWWRNFCVTLDSASRVYEKELEECKLPDDEWLVLKMWMHYTGSFTDDLIRLDRLIDSSRR